MRCEPCALDWDGPRVRFCGRCGALLAHADASADGGGDGSRGYEPTDAGPRSWRGPAGAVVLALAVALAVTAMTSWLGPSGSFEVPETSALSSPPAAQSQRSVVSRVAGRCAADAGILPPSRRAAAREAGALATVDGQPCILEVVRAPADRCPVVAPSGCRLR